MSGMSRRRFYFIRPGRSCGRIEFRTRKGTLRIVRSVPFLFYSPYAIFVSLSLSVTVTPPR